MDVNPLLEVAGVKLGAVAGSALGALCSLRFIDKTRSVYVKTLMVLFGFVFAVYATSFASELLDMRGRVENGMAFIFGLFGMSLADSFMAWIKNGGIINMIKGKVG